MKIKGLYLILCIALLAAAMTGCADSAAASDESIQEATTEMEQELTMEYIIAHSELTEADFEGVDFADFVAMYELTVADVEEYYMPDLLAMYHRAKAAEPTVDYTDIYSSAQGQLTGEDLAQIQVLVWEYHEGNGNAYMVIDYEAKAVYVSQADIISRCGESSKVADLTQEDISFIQSALETSGITGWNREYTGTNEGTTGNFSWSIGFRLADGRCVTYSGSGVLNSGTPGELNTLVKALADRFPG